MSRRNTGAVVASLLSLALLGACSQQQEAAAPAAAEGRTLHQVMLADIDEPADQLWDVANTAIGFEGGLDPTLMDDAKWDRIAMLADKVAGGAGEIVAMEVIDVAPAGTAIGDSDVPGGHSAEQVQAFIDANPALMRDMADTLRVHVSDLADAARAHDAARAGPLIDQLDSVCESCHLNFWYPEQKDLVEQFQNEGVVDPDHPALGPRGEQQ